MSCSHSKNNRKYYKQRYSYKFNNLEEMDQFRENQKLPKLEEIGYLNSPIIITEINLYCKSPRKKNKKYIGSFCFTGEF